MPNAWQEHLSRFRSTHPGVPLKQCMQGASLTYRGAAKADKAAPSAHVTEGCKRKGMEVRQWLHAVKTWCLQKRDVDAMEPGDEVCLICLDRNVLDIAMDSNPENEAIDVSQFFRNNVVTYTNRSAPFGYLFRHDGSMQKPEDFVFHVNYEPHSWYPLSDDGTLPVFDPQQKIRLQQRNKPKPWKEFAPNMLVGWRGAMLPLLRVKDLPIQLRKVWYDPEWPSLSCASWGASMHLSEHARVKTLQRRKLDPLCQTSKPVEKRAKKARPKTNSP